MQYLLDHISIGDFSSDFCVWMTLKSVAGSSSKAEFVKAALGSALTRFDYYFVCENPISNCQVFYLYFSDQTSKTIGKMASSCSKYKHLLDRTLRKFFYLLGYRIGQTPTYFIIVPILLTALLATGVQQMNYNYDPEYLFSPKGGEAKYERAIQEEFFPVNFSDFKASRIARPGKFGRVIVAAKDGGSMLRTELWHQLLYLDQVRISNRGFSPKICVKLKFNHLILENFTTL